MENTDDKVRCGCGRSPSGYCTGLHSMTEEEYDLYIMEQFEKPLDIDPEE
jgi:CDGSH-type Zn-finger protein